MSLRLTKGSLFAYAIISMIVTFMGCFLFLYLTTSVDEDTEQYIHLPVHLSLNEAKANLVFNNSDYSYEIWELSDQEVGELTKLVSKRSNEGFYRWKRETITSYLYKEFTNGLDFDENVRLKEVVEYFRTNKTYYCCELVTYPRLAGKLWIFFPEKRTFVYLKKGDESSWPPWEYWQYWPGELLDGFKDNEIRIDSNTK